MLVVTYQFVILQWDERLGTNLIRPRKATFYEEVTLSKLYKMDHE